MREAVIVLHSASEAVIVLHSAGEAVIALHSEVNKPIVQVLEREREFRDDLWVRERASEQEGEGSEGSKP